MLCCVVLEQCCWVEDDVQCEERDRGGRFRGVCALILIIVIATHYNGDRLNRVPHSPRKHSDDKNTSG